MLATPQIKSRFDEILGKRAPAFISSIVSAVAGNKELEKCDPRSVIASAAIAASMDLPINPSLGLAHIVPYKGTAQFQMGWKGYVQLALRSGQYKTIHASIIYEGQIKNINHFTGAVTFNEDGGPSSNKVVGYMLYFTLLNGFEKYFYMSQQECHDHGQQYSAAYKKGFGPWVDNFDAMALKTVVKLGLSKYGILSLEMQSAMKNEEPVERLVAQLHDDAANEAVVEQLDEIQVDTVQSPELESQESTAFGNLVTPVPGDMLVKLGPDDKPGKIKDMSKEKLMKFVTWAYAQSKLNQTSKVYLANIEAFLEGESENVEA